MDVVRMVSGGAVRLAWGLSLSVGLIIGCSENRPATVPTAKAAPLATAPAVRQQDVIATGPVIVEQQLELLAPRDGEIAQINADLGASVRKGEVLATLDQRQLASERDAQLAKVRSIEADLKNWAAETKVRETDRERARQMWEAKLITEQAFEHARYKAEASAFEVEREEQALNQAKSTLEVLEMELAKSRIVAPFSGVVARRYVTAGQKVVRNERLFWISAMSPLRVKFILPAEKMLLVATGTKLEVSPAYEEATAGHVQNARITHMSPVVDPASGTFEVVAELEGGGSLRPGMTAAIRLPLAPEKRK
jgi:membrane fusion protein, multidrug efflux system